MKITEAQSRTLRDVFRISAEAHPFWKHLQPNQKAFFWETLHFAFGPASLFEVKEGKTVKPEDAPKDWEAQDEYTFSFVFVIPGTKAEMALERKMLKSKFEAIRI